MILLVCSTVSIPLKQKLIAKITMKEFIRISVKQSVLAESTSKRSISVTLQIT